METREAIEREIRVEAEIYFACNEVAMAQLKTEVAGSARAQVESELARVQRAFVSLDGRWSLS